MQYAVFKQKHFYYKINLQSQLSPYWHGSRICLKKFLEITTMVKGIKIQKKTILEIR